MVPSAVVKLHEADAALDEAPRQQTVVRKRRLPGRRAIQIMNGLWLLRKVLQLWDAGLHVVRHLVSGDSRLNLRIADFTGVVAIERVDQVQGPSLGGWGHTGRVRDEHNRIT